MRREVRRATAAARWRRAGAPAAPPADRAAADAARRFRRSSGRRATPRSSRKGATIYGIHCRACHGVDLRGGDIGGPNLLRSQLALNDLEGELIGPVIISGRQNPGMPVMPPLPLAPDDIKAVAAHIHAVQATMRGQGSPPPGTEKPPNILVGRRQGGAGVLPDELLEVPFAGRRPGGACRPHRRSGDQLQNLWVGGGGGGRGRGGPPAPGEGRTGAR